MRGRISKGLWSIKGKRFGRLIDREILEYEMGVGKDFKRQGGFLQCKYRSITSRLPIFM